MFDLPDAKRVRRSDIYSSPSHSNHDSNSPSDDSDHDENETTKEPDLELQEKLRARLAALYGDTLLRTSPREHVQLARAISSATESKPLLKKRKAKGPKLGGEEGEVVGDVRDASKPSIDQEGKGRPQDDTTIPEEREQDQEHEFEFRLFSVPSQTAQSTSAPASQTQKIILTPSSDPYDPFDPSSQHTKESGAFLRNTKDPRTFVVGKASGERLEGYRAMAVGGEHVLKESGRRNWGLEVGWRVLVLTGPAVKRVRNGGFDGVQKGVQKDGDDGKEGRRKVKPNKKRRIVLRERMKKVEMEREKKIKEELLKGENEREKRTRRNREKKVKRKAKLKAVGVVGAVGGDGKVEEDGKEMAVTEGKRVKMDVD